MMALTPLRLLLSEIYDLAWRYVPAIAADDRLYTSGPRSWWPAHEIGHFLVATPAECRQPMFGIADDLPERAGRRYHYLIARELAATSISQRLLRRSRHAGLADEEIEYTAEDTLDCRFDRWCRSSVARLLRANRAARLPTTLGALERLLRRKALEVDTTPHNSFSDARRAPQEFVESGRDVTQPSAREPIRKD